MIHLGCSIASNLMIIQYWLMQWLAGIRQWDNSEANVDHNFPCHMIAISNKEFELLYLYNCDNDKFENWEQIFET